MDWTVWFLNRSATPDGSAAMVLLAIVLVAEGARRWRERWH